MGPTPVKSLRASAVVLNRTAEQDAAWVRQVEAAKGRLRHQQGSADAPAVAGPEPAVEGAEPAKAAALDVVEAGPRSSGTAEAAVAVAMSEAPVHDAERAGADVTMEEVASVSGQETVLAKGSQPRQGPLAEPAGMVEVRAVEPLSGVPEEEAPAPAVPTVEARVPEPSSVEVPAPVAPAVVSARPHAPLDNISLDKGKQTMGVEGGEVADQAGVATAVGEVDTAGEAGPSAGPGDAPAGSSSSWPDIAALAIARAETELPKWGGRPLSSGTLRTPTPSPSLSLATKTKCTDGSTSRASAGTLIGCSEWRLVPCGAWGMPPRCMIDPSSFRGFLGVFFPRLFNLFGFFFGLRSGAEGALPPQVTLHPG